MKYRMASRLALAVVVSAVMTAKAAVADSPQHHHEHHHGMAAAAVSEVAAPALEILMPGMDNIVGRQLAVVLQTPADLDAMTMSAAKIGVHLHVDLDGLSLMPTRQQLIDLGSNRYLFLFDLPAKPGKNTIKVYWADAEHRVIESSVRSVTVEVRP